MKKTTVRYYDNAHGAMSEAQLDLDKVFVTITARENIGGDVWAYPMQFEIPLSELRRLLAIPQKTPKPPLRVVTAAHETGAQEVKFPEPTREPKLVS